MLRTVHALIEELIADGVSISRGTDMNLTHDEYSQIAPMVNIQLACDFKEGFDAFAPRLGSEVKNVEDLVNFNDLHAVRHLPCLLPC